jgi:hypothetical protein
MKQHKWHKEIKAWADGAVIQTDISEVKEEPIWIDVHSPAWDINDEYRIKPQPKTPKQAWDEELTRSYKETIIERLRNDDKFYDEVFSAYDNVKDHEIKPQPKEQQYLYVFKQCNTDEIDITINDERNSDMVKIGQLQYIGKIKLEVENGN